MWQIWNKQAVRLDSAAKSHWRRGMQGHTGTQMVAESHCSYPVRPGAMGRDHLAPSDEGVGITHVEHMSTHWTIPHTYTACEDTRNSHSSVHSMRWQTIIHRDHLSTNKGGTSPRARHNTTNSSQTCHNDYSMVLRGHS